MKIIPILFGSLLMIITLNGQVKNAVITAYGAKADGRTNNAVIIQKLIDKASIGGGGKVIIPTGNFMTGSLILKSGVTLQIDLGGVLLGSPFTKDYLKLEGRNALLLAANQKNISIKGEGIIDGQGQELMLDVFQH